MPQRDLTKSLHHGQEVRTRYKGIIKYGKFDLNRNVIITDTSEHKSVSNFALRHKNDVQKQLRELLKKQDKNTTENTKNRQASCGTLDTEAKIVDPTLINKIKDKCKKYREDVRTNPLVEDDRPCIWVNIVVLENYFTDSNETPRPPAEQKTSKPVQTMHAHYRASKSAVISEILEYLKTKDLLNEEVKKWLLEFDKTT